EVCRNRKCLNVCKDPNSCGKNAVCQATDRRKVCLCPDGYQGDPKVACKPYECRLDTDCESNKRCSPDGACKNPCRENRACGVNAQCRVIERKPHCSCPPGFIGNALVECKKGGNEECLKNPCGANTKCRDVDGKYECSCAPG